MIYKVNAIIRGLGQKNAVLLEGIYVSKQDEANAVKLKKECSEYIRSNIKTGNGVTKEDIQKIDIQIRYQKMKDDFMVCEDKI
jgi:hypothetical protein